MAKLHKGAFAIMAMCEETKQPFGITVDPRGHNTYALAWAFKIKPGQALSRAKKRLCVSYNNCKHRSPFIDCIEDYFTQI